MRRSVDFIRDRERQEMMVPIPFGGRSLGMRLASSQLLKRSPAQGQQNCTYRTLQGLLTCSPGEAPPLISSHPPGSSRP